MIVITIVANNRFVGTMRCVPVSFAVDVAVDVAAVAVVGDVIVVGDVVVGDGGCVEDGGTSLFAPLGAIEVVSFGRRCRALDAIAS
jgi:hypothetical protein